MVRARVVIYSLWGWLGTILATIGVLAAGVVQIKTGSWAQLWPWIPALALIWWLITILWAYPRLVLSQDGIYAYDPWRTVFIPWSQLQNAQARLGLQLVTAKKTYSVWAAPARGGIRLTHDKMDTSHQIEIMPVPSGPGAKSTVRYPLNADQAAALINRERLIYRETPPSAQDPGQARIRVAWPALVPLVVLLLATVAVSL